MIGSQKATTLQCLVGLPAVDTRRSHLAPQQPPGTGVHPPPFTADPLPVQVLAPATFMTSLQQLRWLDLRGILVEAADYWTPDKCATMQHVAALAKALKRRRGGGRRAAARGGGRGPGLGEAIRVLYDTS